MELDWIPEWDRKRGRTLIASCRCPKEDSYRWHRLGDRRAVHCLKCGVMMARVGDHITTVVFPLTAP